MDADRPHVLMLLASLGIGGIERMVLSLVRALSHRFRFSAVAFDSDGPLAKDFRDAGAEAFVLRRRPGIDATYPGLLGRRLRGTRVDLVHCHNETALFYGRLAAAAARIPAVYTEHDRCFPGARRTAVLNRLLARSCRGVVAVSARLRAELETHEGIDPRRVRVIRNGVDGAPFSAAPERDAVRAELGVPPGRPLVVCAGRLSREKGIDVLVAAAEIVRREASETAFAVAGEGRERVALEGPARRAGVRLLGARRDVARLMLACDVVAIPSRSEGLPLAAAEAAAAERPVVASDVGAMSEVVVRDETGLLVPPEDPASLAAAIRGLLADPSRRAAMGAAARRRFLAGFTLQRMASEYAEVYAAALGVS